MSYRWLLPLLDENGWCHSQWTTMVTVWKTSARWAFLRSSTVLGHTDGISHLPATLAQLGRLRQAYPPDLMHSRWPQLQLSQVTPVARLTARRTSQAPSQSPVWHGSLSQWSQPWAARATDSASCTTCSHLVGSRRRLACQARRWLYSSRADSARPQTDPHLTVAHLFKLLRRWGSSARKGWRSRALGSRSAWSSRKSHYQLLAAPHTPNRNTDLACSPCTVDRATVTRNHLWRCFRPVVGQTGSRATSLSVQLASRSLATSHLSSQSAYSAASQTSPVPARSKSDLSRASHHHFT